MSIPDNIEALAEELGLPVEKLLEAVASDEQLMTRIEQKLRPFSLMGRTERVRPDEPVSDLAARVWCSDGVLFARFPEYNEDFRDAMHRQNLSWQRSERRWRRKLQPWHGRLRDRLVELCCEIIAAGFVCEIPHADLAEAVHEEDYEEEHTRWVLRRTAGDYEDWFVIVWDRDVEDLYEEARDLPGSRYDKPDVVVPADAYDAVRDFAEKYDFRLSESAKALAEATEEQEAADLISDPEAPEKQAAPSNEVPEKAADVNPEIDPDLRDDS